MDNKKLKGTHLFNGFSRLGSFPLDSSSLFYSREAAEEYAKNNPTAYYGQILIVLSEYDEKHPDMTKVSLYQIEDIPKKRDDGEVELENGELVFLKRHLVPIGTGGSGGGSVVSVNGVFPNPYGNIELYSDKIKFSEDQEGRTHTVKDLESLVGFLKGEGNDDLYEISKPLSAESMSAESMYVSSTEIGRKESVVNVDTLNRSIDRVVESATRNVEIPFNIDGINAYDFTTPLFKNGARITGAKVIIHEGFTSQNGVDITFGISKYTPDGEIFEEDPDMIFREGDIFEDEKGVYISETMIDLNIDESDSPKHLMKLFMNIKNNKNEELASGKGSIIVSYINRVSKSK